MIKVAITGVIGSGKSYIAGQMKELLGIPVYDSDSNAKRLNEESETIRRGLVSMIGADVYDADGHLDKSRLASFLFASEENASRVNALVHPVVREDFLRWADEQHSPVVAIETALLLESGIDKLVDKVIRVDAPLETRIARAMRRDGVGREKILERIARQKEYPNPDIIINNV
ncbi:MAG: dephospho-CoA kinase [Bacteroidaceae bacterium]|nr:dephospho-CoA kinase [Bacteroidaceae bacterium]